MTTKVSDLAIVPQTFRDYVNKLILERSAFVRSGFVADVPSVIPDRGTVVNAPAYLGFQGGDQVLSDASSLTVNSVGSINAVTPINFRGYAVGSNMLVSMLAGKDPLGDLASKLADYWVRQYDATLISSVLGSATGMEAAYDTAIGAGTYIINDQSGVAINGDLVIDTKQLAGEFASDMTIMVCHSAVKSALEKQNLTNTVAYDSQAPAITTYMGMQIVVDDNLAPNAGVYDVIFGRPASTIYSNYIDPSQAIEVDRDVLSGDDIVASRTRYLMHPNGATWIGTSAGVSPTNVELSTGTNWSAADLAQPKSVPFRVLKCLIA